MARLLAAIVHSSMHVAPCHPNSSISTTEKPTLTSAAPRVIRPAIGMSPAMSSAALNRITAG